MRAHLILGMVLLALATAMAVGYPVHECQIITGGVGSVWLLFHWIVIRRIRKIISAATGCDVSDKAGHADSRFWVGDELVRLEHAVDGTAQKLRDSLQIAEHEISERKRLEALLFRNEQKYRAIFDHTFQFIGLISIGGIVLEANRSALKFAGIQESDVLNKPFWETYWWKHSSELQERLRLSVTKAANGEFIRFEATHPSPDGILHVIDFSIKPIWDDTENVVFLIVEGRDITELKINQEQLRKHRDCLEEIVRERTRDLAEAKEQTELAYQVVRQSENTYRTIFDNAGTALVIIDGHMMISLANTQFEKLSGYSREEIEGRMKWSAFLSDEDLGRITMYHYSRMTDPLSVPAHYEFRLVDKQGGYNNIIATVAMIPDTGKRVISLLDITEMKKMEAELQNTRRYEAIGIYTGGIAHDFNNIMGSVMGNISLAQLCAKNPEPDVQRSLSRAEEACVQARNLTRRLITLTTSRNPVRKLESIQELIESAVKDLCDDQIQFKYDFPEDIWRVDCDSSQIREVITNLIVNACESMQSGGTLEISVHNVQMVPNVSPVLKAARYVHLSIRDYGKGIPDELVSRVFDPYFSTKERGAMKGMGLGLSMAYSIVKKHDGDIRIESRVDAGTVVHVYLPASGERFLSK